MKRQRPPMPPLAVRVQVAETRVYKPYVATTSNKFFPRVGGTIEERFWSKVSPEPNTGCWLWCGDSNGHYGNIGTYRDGRWGRVLAHRVSFEIHKGTIPKHLQIDHECRVKMCVNPDHLRIRTPQQNVLHIPPGIRGNNQIKEFCKRGHPLSGENLRFDSRGHAACRVCGNMHSRNYTARQKLK